MREIEKGFTLVELLLVLMLSVLVLAGVSTTFTAVVGAEDRVAAANESDRLGRVLAEKIRREIVSTVRGVYSSAVVGGAPVVGIEKGDRDEIILECTAYGGVSTIRYFWKEGIYYRGERPAHFLGEGFPVPLRKVSGIQLRYFDGAQWRNGWNEKKNPEAVSFEFSIGDKTYFGLVTI